MTADELTAGAPGAPVATDTARTAGDVAGTELVAGLLLALGVLTPLACAGIIGVMFNVIAGVSWDGGLYGQNGYELPLLFGLVAAGLAFTGPGRLAVDHGRWAGGGIVTGLASLALGVASGLVVLLGFQG